MCFRFLGPQLDWDPDIVAGLDVDFNFDDPDNVLEDDFISKAEGALPAGETELQEELELVVTVLIFKITAFFSLYLYHY